MKGWGQQKETKT